jgi:F0F1-type ATP synthase delta subunit
MQNNATFLLPVSIVSPTDIARLSREIENLDNNFREQAIRNPGTTNVMPQLSNLLGQLAADNQLNLLNDVDRSKVLQLLTLLHKSAPVMHISFSIDPPGAYVQKIVDWLRHNIHQHVLVTVGLQPNIGAGCVVRTNNKLFDFSLREYFSQKREFFIDKLHQAISDEGVSVAAQSTTEPIVVESQPQPAIIEQPVVNPNETTDTLPVAPAILPAEPQEEVAAQ